MSQSRSRSGTAILLVAPLLACSGGAEPSRDPENFNVLIVVLDALRADKLGCHDFERPASPNIDAFAADPQAVVFRRHHVQGAFTKSSTASLFTGLFPFQHGVIEGHEPKNKDLGWRDVTTQVLDASHETLAERLKARGFHTFGVVKSRHLVSEYGFDQGFDRYVGPAEIGDDQGRLEEVLDLIDAAPGRFFGYVHFSATHHPYPPDGRDPDYMEEFGFPYDERARQATGADFTTPDVKNAILQGGLRLAPDDERFLHLIYEATLRRVDRELFGALIDGLEERGVYDSTLIVLTADHGEELYDHEGYAHQYHVWEEIIHVPLIVKFPDGKRPERLPSEVTDVTSAIDVMPSLCALLGDAEDDLPGVPIFTGAAASFALSEATRRFGLIRGGFKLIKDPKRDLLFDLKNDPLESNDLAAAEPEHLRELNAFAEVLFESARGKRTVAPVIDTTLAEDALRELHQFGYIDK